MMNGQRDIALPVMMYGNTHNFAITNQSVCDTAVLSDSPAESSVGVLLIK